RDRGRHRGAGGSQPVFGRTIARPARQWPQGRDSDPRISRSPRRNLAARRPAPHQQTPPRSVSRGGRYDTGKRSVPGGASGLQIREGPRAGPWWVRLPLSSASHEASAMTPFLDALARAATDAEAAEAAFRRDIATRAKALEQERAFAFRRLNFMRAIAAVIADAENEDMAVASAQE